MNAKELVDTLLDEANRLRDDPGMAEDFQDFVQQTVDHLETHLGDVVGEETTDEQASEEAWTLAIDFARDAIRSRGSNVHLPKNTQYAIDIAKEAAHRVGYTPRGYRPWSPRATIPTPKSAAEQEQERHASRVVQPTGVFRPAYDPRQSR